MGQRHCWQTLYFPSHLCDCGLQIYSFFENANYSLQNTPESHTPLEVGSENAPEAAHGWLGNPFSEISQRKMPAYSAGERRPHIEWGTGILCYSFFKTKIIINMLLLVPTVDTGITNHSYHEWNLHIITQRD